MRVPRTLVFFRDPGQRERNVSKISTLEFSPAYPKRTDCPTSRKKCLTHRYHRINIRHIAGFKCIHMTSDRSLTTAPQSCFLAKLSFSIDTLRTGYCFCTRVQDGMCVSRLIAHSDNTSIIPIAEDI